MQWLALNSQEIPSFKRVFHIPNEGQRTKTFAWKLQRMGVRAGAADYIWMLGPGGRCLFFEMKTAKGKQSEAQKLFEQDCKEADAQYWIFRSWTEAADFMLLLLFSEQRITQTTYNRIRPQLI